MNIFKRLSIYAHGLSLIGLIMYTVYFRLTYHLIDVPEPYLLDQQLFWANLNILLSGLYALYIVGYIILIKDRDVKWLYLFNAALSVVVIIRAIIYIDYMFTNMVAILLFTYQLGFSLHKIKTQNIKKTQVLN